MNDMSYKNLHLYSSDQHDIQKTKLEQSSYLVVFRGLYLGEGYVKYVINHARYKVLFLLTLSMPKDAGPLEK